MELKRFKNIVAFKYGHNVPEADTIVAFHSSNMEVAEITSEAFNLMSPIDPTTSEIPEQNSSESGEAFNELTSWNEEVNPGAKAGALSFGIRSLTINVNQICNLKCTYCAAGGDGTYGEPTNQIEVEKTLPQLKYFLSSVKTTGKFSITFVGGEPLLHPKAIEAVYHYVTNYCDENQITPQFTVVTNGTLFSPETLEILRKLKIQLTVSLDGTKDVNDLNRPSKNGKSTTDMILAGLSKLSEDRGEVISIGIAAVVTKNNQDIISNYHFFKSLNPDWIEFNFPYAEKSPALQKAYIDQMNELASLAWELGRETELRRLRFFDHYFNMLDSQQRIENHCGAGKTYLMIDSKNRLYTCPWVVGEKEEVVGNGTTIDAEKIAKYSKSLIELNNCQSCWAKHLCGGGCMYIHSQHTGNKHVKDNLFCERTRSLLLIALSYYKIARSA